MTTRDLLNPLKYEQVLAPQTVQASAVSSGNIDTQGFDSLSVAVLVGNIADTLGAGDRLDLSIEHADDDGTGNPGTYTACTNDDVLGFSGLTSGIFKAIDADAEDQTRYVIGYRGDKRFVRVTATPVSLATGGPVAMMAVKGHPHTGPADNS